MVYGPALVTCGVPNSLKRALRVFTHWVSSEHTCQYHLLICRSLKWFNPCFDMSSS